MRKQFIREARLEFLEISNNGIFILKNMSTGLCLIFSNIHDNLISIKLIFKISKYFLKNEILYTFKKKYGTMGSSLIRPHQSRTFTQFS